MSSPVLDCFDGMLSVSNRTTTDNKATIPAKIDRLALLWKGRDSYHKYVANLPI